MASPICPSSWNKANFGSSVCDLLKSLLLTNDRLRQFFEWMFNTHPQSGECHLSEAFGAELVQMLTPIGSTFWTPVEIPINDLDPEVWVLCDGQELAKVGIYAKLYSIVKDKWGEDPWSPPIDDDNFKVPDLKGRFQLNAGRRQITQPPPPEPQIPEPPNYAIFERGGEDEITLTPDQSGMIDHKHGYGGVKADQPQGGGNETTFSGLEIHVEDDPDDEGNTRTIKYPAGESYTTVQIDTTDPRSSIKNYDFYSYVTGKPIEELLPDLDDENVVNPTQPHSIMPPYLVGYTYMRANFKINGRIVEVPNPKIVIPPL